MFGLVTNIQNTGKGVDYCSCKTIYQYVMQSYFKVYVLILNCSLQTQSVNRHECFFSFECSAEMCLTHFLYTWLLTFSGCVKQ